MSRNRRNGYAGLPALLAAGAFVLPLLGRTVEWLGLPGEVRVALPLLLGLVAIAGIGQSRRAMLSDATAPDEQSRPGRGDDAL